MVARNSALSYYLTSLFIIFFVSAKKALLFLKKKTKPQNTRFTGEAPTSIHDFYIRDGN